MTAACLSLPQFACDTPNWRASSRDFGSGDIAEVFPSANGCITVVVADVSGHGPLAARYAFYLRNALRALMGETSPARILERINREFSRHLMDGRLNELFASMFFASVNADRVLTYASAGHDVGILISHDGRMHRHLRATGMLLGVDAGERYDEVALDVQPGDCLTLVTDGITDARNARGAFFGTAGVARSAMRAVRSATHDPAAAVLSAARDFTGGTFADDASVVCVRVL